MTTTVPARQAALPDPATVLKREDARLARKAGDDPLPASTIDAFAQVVQRQIIEPLLAGHPVAPSQDTELRAENARLTDAVDTLRRQVNDQAEQIDKARALRAQLDTATAAAATAQGELEKAKRKASQAEAELAAARQKHQHLYPIPAPGTAAQPCACGQPYPRTQPSRPRQDIPSNPPEPWAELIDQLRVELAHWHPNTRSKP